MNTQNFSGHTLSFFVLSALFLSFFAGASFSEASVSSGEVARDSGQNNSSYQENAVLNTLSEEKQEEVKAKIAELCVSRAEIRESRKEMYTQHRKAKKEKYAELRKQLQNKEITISQLFQARKDFIKQQREIRKDFLEASKKIKRGGIEEVQSFFKNLSREKRVSKFIPALKKAKSVKVCKFMIK